MDTSQILKKEIWTVICIVLPLYLLLGGHEWENYNAFMGIFFFFVVIPCMLLTFYLAVSERTKILNIWLFLTPFVVCGLSLFLYFNDLWFYYTHLDGVLLLLNFLILPLNLFGTIISLGAQNAKAEYYAKQGNLDNIPYSANKKSRNTRKISTRIIIGVAIIVGLLFLSFMVYEISGMITPHTYSGVVFAIKRKALENTEAEGYTDLSLRGNSVIELNREEILSHQQKDVDEFIDYLNNNNYTYGEIMPELLITDSYFKESSADLIGNYINELVGPIHWKFDENDQRLCTTIYDGENEYHAVWRNGTFYTDMYLLQMADEIMNKINNEKLSPFFITIRIDQNSANQDFIYKLDINSITMTWQEFENNILLPDRIKTFEQLTKNYSIVIYAGVDVQEHDYQYLAEKLNEKLLDVQAYSNLMNINDASQNMTIKLYPEAYYEPVGISPAQIKVYPKGSKESSQKYLEIYPFTDFPKNEDGKVLYEYKIKHGYKYILISGNNEFIEESY